MEGEKLECVLLSKRERGNKKKKKNKKNNDRETRD